MVNMVSSLPFSVDTNRSLANPDLPMRYANGWPLAELPHDFVRRRVYCVVCWRLPEV